MDSINLLGAEDVRRAGAAMGGAAETMVQASRNMDGSLERFQRWADDWLARFEAAVEKMTAVTNEEVRHGNVLHANQYFYLKEPVGVTLELMKSFGGAWHESIISFPSSKECNQFIREISE